MQAILRDIIDLKRDVDLLQTELHKMEEKYTGIGDVPAKSFLPVYESKE